MHELSLAESALEIIEQTAKQNGAAKVTRVLLEIGVLSHVDRGAFEFAFEVVTRGSVADGARLDVRETPGKAWCMLCAKTIELQRLGEACPECERHQLTVTQGEEMRVVSIEVS